MSSSIVAGVRLDPSSGPLTDQRCRRLQRRLEQSVPHSSWDHAESYAAHLSGRSLIGWEMRRRLERKRLGLMGPPLTQRCQRLLQILRVCSLQEAWDHLPVCSPLPD